MECGKDVSDHAKSCPNCGHPVNSIAVTTVELTSKKWKKLTLIAFGLLVVGIPLVLMGEGYAIAGSYLLFGALVVWIAARVGAWWTNS